MNKDPLNNIRSDELPEPYSTISAKIGIKNTLALAEIVGGTYIYFPKVDTITRPHRNKDIREEFNGYNHRELAIKYNLTERWIKEICADLIKKERNKPLDGQISIFEV